MTDEFSDDLEVALDAANARMARGPVPIQVIDERHDWPSDLPWDTGTSPATRNGAKGRRCRRHEWIDVISKPYDIEVNTQTPGVPISRNTTQIQLSLPAICLRCGSRRDPVASRRGRNNRSRGLAIQREIARSLGLLNLQGNGPTDARTEEIYGNAAFVCQVKSGARFPGWMATELAKLPTTGGRIPILAIAETPGPGHRRRAVIVVEIGDWIDLHGGAK